MLVKSSDQALLVGAYALAIWPGIILSRKGEPRRAVTVHSSGSGNVLRSHFQFWTSPKSVGWREER